MVILISFLTLLILLILVLYPMYTQLVEAPDLALRYMAKLDANLERRMDNLTLLMAIVKNEMKQDVTLVNEMIMVQQKIKSIKKRWDNAETRFGLHNTLEQQMQMLYKSMKNYPNLKSSQGLRDLLPKISNVEKYILVDIYNYNEHIKKFKALVRNFPSNLIAESLNIQCKFKPYLQLKNEPTKAETTPVASNTSQTADGQPQAHYFEDDNDPGAFFSK